MTKLLLPALLLFAAVAYAQSKEPSQVPIDPGWRPPAARPSPDATWPSEPKSFFGIEFGKPLLASLPECQKDPSPWGLGYKVDPTGTKICFQRLVDGTFRVDNVSAFPFVWITEIDGKVEQISTSRSAALNRETLSGLVTRFGEPTTEATKEVRTRAGVPYHNQITIWHGHNLTLMFESIGENVDECEIQVFSKTYSALRAAQSGDKARTLANTF